MSASLRRSGDRGRTAPHRSGRRNERRHEAHSQRGQLLDHRGERPLHRRRRDGRPRLGRDRQQDGGRRACASSSPRRPSDPERTWPYKMDRSKGYEENRLITGHQAREPAHLRERPARRAAARDGDDDRLALRRGRRRLRRARGRLARLPRARRQARAAHRGPLAAQRLHQDEAPHAPRRSRTSRTRTSSCARSG